MECLDAPGTKIDRRSVIRPTRFDAMEIARNVVFTVKSFYMDLINSGPISRSLHIWKVKVPLCKSRERVEARGSHIPLSVFDLC